MSYFPFLEPPLFTSKPPSYVVVKQGSTLSLCCKATGSPRPRIEWSRAQPSSDLLPAFQENGCLEVNTVKGNSDEGYICRATNHFGLAETTTTVIAFLTGFVYSIPYLQPFTFRRFFLHSAVRKPAKILRLCKKQLPIGK